MKLFFYFLFILITSTYSTTVAAGRSQKKCEFPKELFKECGKIKISESSQLKQLYPWHVAIYRQRNGRSSSIPINTCGGTLVSNSVIITAGHCLADDANGSLRNIAEYYVTAGNDFREFNDNRDSEVRQIRQVKRVILPKIYRGHGSDFLGDIAIVVVDQPLIFSPVVQPACIGGITTNALSHDSIGLTVGWGLTTASRDPNTKLSKLSVPFVNIEKCRQAISNEFKKYLNGDKFCGVFTNGSTICATDNGGGVLYSDVDNTGNSRLYLRGVASVGLISGGTCESTQYTAFTDIEPYLSELCQVINSSS